MNEDSESILRIANAGESYRLNCIGDLHWGSRFCNRDTVREAVKRDCDGILLMGDLIECATRYSVGTGVYEQSSPQEQVDDVLTLLEPVKHKIVGLLTGNHEMRAYKESGVDLSSLMARTLGVPYLGYSALLELKVGKNLRSIYATHGATSSSTVQGKLKKCTNLADVALADVYYMGHTHELAHIQTIVTMARYGKVHLLPRLFSLTGSFLNYDGSYAEMKSYPRVRKGFVTTEFTEEDIKIKEIEL